MDSTEGREETLFEAARQLIDPAERQAFLDLVCSGAPAMRNRLETMLAALKAADSFFLEGKAVLEQSRVEVRGPFEKPGDHVGRYKLLEKIGEGGYGVVYMAEQQEPVRRRVALKVIKLGMDTRSVVARFEAERQALALMDHPNIARVLDAGSTEAGRPYFVMELVRGIRITEYCDTNRVSTSGRLELFVQACQAVQHAHQKGIIHRDIKPSNILVTEHDGIAVPKVIDFGIAKATEQPLTDKTLFTAFAQFLGTPAYMSPEQASITSGDIDTRADIYSLGVLLYELLTGRTPFDTQQLLKSGWEAMRRTICERDPPRPSTSLGTMTKEHLTSVARRQQTEPSRLVHQVRGDLDWIVMKCLEKDRVRRYETANGLASDVQRFLANEAIVARPPSKFYRLQKSVRRNRLLFAAGAAIFVALLAGFLVSTSQFVQKSRAYARVVTAEAEQRRLLKETQLAHADQARLREKAEARAYTADMGLALQAWEEGNMQRAQELLSAYVPGPTEPDLRGFEWRYLWKLCQDESSFSFTNFSSDVRSLALSRDGRFLAASGKQSIALIEIATGREVTELFPTGWANSVDFSPIETDILAAGGANGIVDFWNTRTREVVASLSGYPNAISQVAFSPDGKKLALAGWGTTLQLWDIESKTNVWAANTMLPIGTALFTADGASLISGGGPIGNPLVWDAGTGKGLAPLGLQHRGLVLTLALSPDGKNVATGSVDSSIVVWDFSARRPLFTMLGHIGPVLSLAFARDGKHIASGGTDHTVRVWDLLSGKQIRLLRGHRGPVNVVAFAPDSRSIFSASEDHSVKVWSLNPEPMPRVMSPSGTYLKAIALSPDDRFLAAVDYVDSSTRLWDIASGRAIARLPDSPKSPLSAAFSPRGDTLAVGGNTRTITLWRVATRQTIDVLTNDFPAGSLAFSPDGRILAVGGLTLDARKVPASLTFWDLESRQKLNRLPETITNVTVVTFDSSGQLVAVGELGGVVQVWDFSKQELIAQFHEHDRSVTHLAFSSDDRQLASAGEDQIAVLYNLSARSAYQLKRHTVGVSCVAFAPDDKTLASAGSDGTINLWNIATRQVALTLKGHVGPVSGFAFTRKGDLMASCGADGVVRLWPADTVQK